MKTRFKIKGFLPLLLCGCLFLIIVAYSIEIINNQFYENKPIVSLILLIFLVFTLLWLLLGEVKNKFIIVQIENNQLFISKMGGLWKIKIYNESQIDGWKYSILPSRSGYDEYLYLYSNGKKIAKISEFYHKNYSEFKQFVQKRYVDLGFEKFSYIAELKEIFD